MLCVKPYVQGVHAFPCGQCDPCLMSRSKVWAHRIYLESLCHAENSFLTLTYSEECLPRGIGGLAQLQPRDLQLFFKRFRKAFGVSADNGEICSSVSRVRYFAVGEYGDENERPHYHAALFGVPWNDPVVLELVRAAWPMGHVMLAELNPSTSKYIAGYVTKKYGRKDLDWLAGRHPEFSRMSNRPGIGALAMPDIAANLLAVENGRYVGLMEDVPTSLEMEGRQFPLGRYLRRRLRVELGLPPGAPESVIEKWSQEMRSLLEAHFGPASFSNPWSKARIREFLIKESKGAVANVTAKFKIFKQKRSL